MRTYGWGERLESVAMRYHIEDYFSDPEGAKRHMRLAEYDRGEYLYPLDERRHTLVFFLSGKLKVCTNLSNGKSLLISFYTSFQMIGDLEFFEPDTSLMTIQAVLPCTCILLYLDELRETLRNDPVFLSLTAHSLAGKLLGSAYNSSINLLYPLENRLAAYIYQVSENRIFCENLTYLAEIMGASYRHLLRTLSQLQREGILTRASGGYLICDQARLKSLAQDLYVQ